MMPIEMFSLSRDGDKNLSTHFKVREFRCFDDSDEIKVDLDLVNRLLQPIRDKYGPVSINSAYRTNSHNASVGGASNSQHLYGTAADIVVVGVIPLVICQYAEYLMPGAGGIGLYPGFSHVDVRLVRSRWDERSGYSYMTSGFPGYVPVQPGIPMLENTVELYNRYGNPLGPVPSKMIDGLTWVPLRRSFEAMGFIVDHTNGKTAVKWNMNL